MALLEVRNVSKSFGAIHAVNDISWSVEPGEVVGLMGDNGAGKSTLVKLIAGNFPPTDGEVLVDGEVCRFHKPIQARAKGIEVVYQDLALADNLTAAQNVFLGRELNKGFWPFRVLMDEPTAAISVRQVAEVLELIRRLKHQGVAVILISHRMPDVFAVSDRIIVMRRGTKVADKATTSTSPEEITGLITGAIRAA
jgi:simple sugar transport system ATP-binding protein